MNEAYLCLGGNLGNCLTTFNSACALIEEQAGRLTAYSSVYRSPAWGMDKAPDFYNQVIKIETEKSALQLMQLLLSVEKSLGRERDAAADGYKNRAIDIDVLFYNDEVIKTAMLEIPHPRLHLRKFVLEPLAEIAAAYIHPVLKKSIIELLECCPDKGEVKKQVHAA